MPSVGRTRQLLVVVLAAAFLAIAASSASAANELWLWACHGPGGEPLGGSVPGRCDDRDPDKTAYSDGMLVTLPAGQPSRSFVVPPGTSLRHVRVWRSVSALGAGQSYELRTVPDAALETVSAPTSGEFTRAAGGGYVQFGLVGPSEGGTATAEVAALAMRVEDGARPEIAVGGWSDPAAGTLKLEVRATDGGSGLRHVEASLGRNSRQENYGGCSDLTSSADPVDLPVGANCVHVATRTLELATPSPDGDYTLTVRVTDWAGNVAEFTRRLTVRNKIDLGSSTATLQIGSNADIPEQQSAGGGRGSGGVAGASGTACRSPRLSVLLAQKPLRVSSGRPVLQRGKRYRFEGRLTCVINGRRRSAPKRTRIQILNRVGRRTVSKPATRIRDRGRLTVILSYSSTRTIIFRFTNADGQRSQVRIPVRVAKR